MASANTLVAFFGATGGCCAAALTHSLNAGFSCTALARTPSKLIDALLAKGVPQSVITAQLSITEGDVRDVETVRKTLSPTGKVADVIISGIGMYSLGTNTLCATASSTILSALALLQPSHKPLILVLSTTGVSAGPRDIPLPVYPLYKLVLVNPHKDKSNMEKTLTDAMAGTTEAWIRGVVIVRSSLLTDGPALGKATVRVGSERKPAIGYTISREDVGQWVFENVIQDESRDRWAGEKVSLTY